MKWVAQPIQWHYQSQVDESLLLELPTDWKFKTVLTASTTLPIKFSYSCDFAFGDTTISEERGKKIVFSTPREGADKLVSLIELKSK